MARHPPGAAFGAVGRHCHPKERSRMNAPDIVQRLALTREPFPASRKVYVEGSRADVRVPLREIALTNGETVTVYDTSGPYTDPTATIDVRQGLPGVRTPWIEAR